MTSKKRKTPSATHRRIARLERELAAVEAQIARLEHDKRLGLAAQDHFILWKRPSLFVPCMPELLQ